MNTKVLALFGAAVLVATSSELARAQTSCTVSDPTGKRDRARGHGDKGLDRRTRRGPIMKLATIIIALAFVATTAPLGRALTNSTRAREILQ
jgi:hypothetical protein